MVCGMAVMMCCVGLIGGSQSNEELERRYRIVGKFGEGFNLVNW